MRTVKAAALALFVAGCATGPWAGEKDFRPVAPVKPLAGAVAARIRIANGVRRIGREKGALVLELTLANVSEADATIYNELEPGWLVLIEVLGENGKYATWPAPDWVRLGRGRRYHYAHLPRGGFAGRQYVIEPRDPRWDLDPGRYRVRIVYRNQYELCVASPSFTDKDVAELGDKALVPLLTGMIVSNVEEFEVVAE